ncbi:uncharacterized protein LOC8269966 [Ricinus communis]|uniref:Electron transporter, putative n=1 Tax=Ricinus communis TaxID=3988 RepID=B9R8W0_RICCO|nr:uncharacterized protein LOC8269966 [Ricinus communis]EEF52940.1 electron transporter, putative [Ricinus communis]|eukprot:XP_002510753.1 uncharacterized protein LOC8269966 [Ricinus communis]
MPGANCPSPYSSCSPFPYMSSPSIPDGEMLDNVLNISPKLSAHPNSILKSENSLSCEASVNWNSETKAAFTSLICIPYNGTPTPKSSDVLRKEIATLESEILHLERYLLSLYRNAFEERVPPLSNAPKSPWQYKKGSPSNLVVNQSHHNLKPHMERDGFIYHYQTSPAHGWASSDDQTCTASLHSTSKRGQKNANSGRRSLADHLGASCLIKSLNTPDTLSEDILKCISSIYCKLANPNLAHGGLPSSPPSSLSSSSVFSSQNPCDNWSPQYSEDAISHHQVLKEESRPYAAMVEVKKMCLDDDSFNYAATLLKHFRSLVRSLENVDPRKMKREEKLTFWINIHNALVMHAYLAYGTRNRVKGASILKAAYNIGGHCINASAIQNSIFGIRSHYSEPWLQTLFSPGWKSKTGSVRHVYALEYPEPLVHFALCTGAYSDPAVRVYTAQNIFQELKAAKEEFIKASIYIHKEGKIFLPKILSYFAKDMSMDMYGLLEAISGCLTEVQQKAMRRCMRRKVNKYIHWLPRSSTFRYVIHGDLVKGR